MKRLGYEFAAMLVTFVCILYFALQIGINPTTDTFLVSRGKKFVYTGSIISSGKIFFFVDKSMFSEDGLKCYPKRRKQFF